MDDIEEYLKLGIAQQIFEAEKSLIIWNKIAEQIDKYDKQEEFTKRLFSYIQKSSGTHYVLNTAKIFDNPNKKYPTRCLLSFFDLVDKNGSYPKIENTAGLIKLLEKYKCPNILISKVLSPDSTDFAREFCLYYRQKYQTDEIKKAINEVRFARDKFVAHNEHIQINGRVEIETVRILLNFATEAIIIFSFAYYNAKWRIKRDATESVSFIEWTLGKLIKD